MKRLNGKLLLALLLALSMVLTACGGTGGETQEEGKTETETKINQGQEQVKDDGEDRALEPLEETYTVKIAEDGSPSGAGFYIATEKGYFEELGLKSEYVTFSSSSYMLPAIASGEVDVAGGISSVSLFNAIKRGLDIKIIADKGTNIPGKSYFDVVIAKDKVGMIKDYEDLKGKKIVLSGIGGIDEMFVDIALEKGGLSKDDVEYIILESFGNFNAALESGAADVAMHIEPLITQGEEKGILDRWKDATDFAPGFQVAMVLSSPQFTQNKDVSKRFMVAYLKGLRDYYDAFINGKNTDEIIDIMVKHTPMKDKELWKKVNVVGLNPDGYVIEESVADQLEWFKGKGLFEGEIDMGNVIDHSLVDFAVDYLGEYEK